MNHSQSARVSDLLRFIVERAQFELEVRLIQPPPESPAADPGPIHLALTGPDTPLLLASDAELLHALQHLAAESLRLPQDQRVELTLTAT